MHDHLIRSHSICESPNTAMTTPSRRQFEWTLVMSYNTTVDAVKILRIGPKLLSAFKYMGGDEGRGDAMLVCHTSIRSP